MLPIAVAADAGRRDDALEVLRAESPKTLLCHVRYIMLHHVSKESVELSDDRVAVVVLQLCNQRLRLELELINQLVLRGASADRTVARSFA